MPAFRFKQPGGAEDRQIVALRAAAGENDLAGLAAEDFRRAFARVVEAPAARQEVSTAEAGFQFRVEVFPLGPPITERVLKEACARVNTRTKQESKPERRQQLIQRGEESPWAGQVTFICELDVDLRRAESYHSERQQQAQ